MRFNLQHYLLINNQIYQIKLKQNQNRLLQNVCFTDRFRLKSCLWLASILERKSMRRAHPLKIRFIKESDQNQLILKYHRKDFKHVLNLNTFALSNKVF